MHLLFGLGSPTRRIPLPFALPCVIYSLLFRNVILAVILGLANFEYAGKDLLQMDAFGFLVPSSQDLPVLGVVLDTCSFPQVSEENYGKT